MDIGTIVGLIAGIGLVLWSIIVSGTLSAFIDGPSMIIVVGGSAAAYLVCFPLRQSLSILEVIKNGFFAQSTRPTDVIKDMVRFAEIARRDGILSLEDALKDVDDPFVVSGVRMAVDGMDPRVIEQVLTNDAEAVGDRHAQGKALFDAIGKYAPAFGMVGTLVGLVVMLKNMDNPSAIGPGMAVALLTTLYGALIANVICLPIADKLANRSAEEMLIKSIVIRGVMAIQSGDNPRIVEQKLKAFLPPRMRQGRVARQAKAPPRHQSSAAQVPTRTRQAGENARAA